MAAKAMRQMPASPPSSFGRRSVRPGSALDALGEPVLVRPHAVEQAVEACQLHACDRALELRGPEVPAREARETGAAAKRARAVVDVDRQFVDVVAVGDHHAALAGRDDLVELQAERPRVAERPEPAAAVRGARGLADVLDEHEPVVVRERRERGHVSRRAAHVHGQDRLRPWADLLRDVVGIERQATRRPPRERASRPTRSPRSGSRSTCRRARSPRRPDQRRHRSARR